jgi:hypothetical protein
MQRVIAAVATLVSLGVPRAGFAQSSAVYAPLICDGTTDNTSALQSAENAREAIGGGILMLPAGVCIVSGTININAGSGKWMGAGSEIFTGKPATIIRDTSTTGDTIAVVSHDGVVFEDLRIDVSAYKTNGAGISIGTPSTTLSANAASGATSITVTNASIFTAGDQIAINLNITGNNSTFITSVSSISGSNITLAQSLPSAANSGNHVWDVYNLRSDLNRVVIRGTYDGLLIDWFCHRE